METGRNLHRHARAVQGADQLATERLDSHLGGRIIDPGQRIFRIQAYIDALSAKDLNAFKAAALAEMNRELAEPETIVTALVARYGIGKDMVSHYKESVNGVTAARITEMLSALAAGSTAEIVIE